MDGVDATQWLAENPDVDHILATVVDLNGTLRGKRVPADQTSKILKGNLRMPLSAIGVDIWGEDIEGSDLVFETGDADGICASTGRGLLPITWTRKPSAIVPLWLSTDDGIPFAGDPRHALAEIVARFKSMGLTPVVATELEFYLVDPTDNAPAPPCSPVTGKRLDSDGVLSVDELEHFDAVLNDIYEACRLQGIPADSAISENGAGQFEINMKHVADPLKAADDAIFFKKIVRGVARKHGFAATFMAKPYGNRAGNGFHVHFSLVDENGVNVFDNGGEEGTELLQQAVAGLLATAQEMSLVFAPHENSYRRLTPGSHAPSAVSWGYENRTVAIRIPGGDPAARRIEHRVAGADANPYLVLAAILGGAWYGMDKALIPSAPVQGNAYAMKKLPHLPLDWATAIEAFETGAHVESIFAPRLKQMFIDCKFQELRGFKQQVTDFEYHTYLEVV